MADTKITQLQPPQVGYPVVPATDVLPIVVIADPGMATSGSTRKVTVNQLLGAGGTATLASATITGDLTVRTNVISATSSGVGFGINTAAAAIDVVSSFQWRSNTGGTDKLAIFSGGAGLIYLGSTTASALSFLYNGSTAMTLNANGLGVGEAASVSRLQPRGSTSDSSAYVIYAKNSGGSVINFMRNDGRFLVGNGTTDNFIVTETGTVGIGVTPSAWAAGYKVIQGQIGGFALSNDNSSNNQFRLSSNAYFDTTNNRWEYYGNSTATAYEQQAGEHRFFNAVSGSADTLIPFVQAMTLDASGNLLVGTTTATVNNNGYRVVNDGNTNSARLELGSASSTNSNIGLSMYSTGAAAYRFYVGWGGTVFATNTTISAISDQRLKENIQDIDVGLGAILALKPRKFDWKAGKGKDIKGDRGFIAQEFEQVFPNLIDEWKDEAPEGEAPYKSVRQDLIPVLVKAIQELAAEVNALKNA